MRYELHSTLIGTADLVIAPDFYISEIANVAWKYSKLAGFTTEQSLSLAEDSNRLIDRYIPTVDLWKEALSESICHNHPVYDLLYMIAARRTSATLISNDKKMTDLAKKLRINIR